MALADTLADHPDKATFDLAELNRAATAAMECSLIASACADSDLARGASAMADCIRLCIDTSDICATTARILSRPSPTGHAWEKLVVACATQCHECAQECAKHDHICCRQCADACRACEQACQQLLAAANKS